MYFIPSYETEIDIRVMILFFFVDSVVSMRNWYKIWRTDMEDSDVFKRWSLKNWS